MTEENVSSDSMTDDDVAVDEQEEVSEETTTEELTDEEALQAKLKEAIAVTVEDVGSLRKKLTINVPRETIDERLGEQYDEIKNEAQVPGFRKGRAPHRLLEKRFGAEIGDQVTASLVGNSYMAAIDKESIEALGDPLLHITVTEDRTDEDGKEIKAEVEKLLPVDEALTHIELPGEGDLSFSCEVDIKPTFELPNLEKIPVKKANFEITGELVDEEIRRMMALRGTYRPVEDGSVEADDVLVGSVKVIVDGEVIKTEDNAELAARDQRYNGMLLEGFGEKAMGKKIGETVAVEVTIANDDTDVQARGKKATFELSILDMKRLEVPELTEEFVTTVGFEGMQEFRDVIKDRMERQVEQEIRRSMHLQIEKHLSDNTELEVPSGISQRQTERLVSGRMMDLYSRGVSESEITKHIDEMRTEAAEEARDSLKHFFIMEKISEDYDVTVNEEELNGAIAEIAERRNLRFDRVRDEIVSKNHLSTLYVRLRDQKILETLLADAEVTEKDVSEKDVSE